MRRTDTPAIVEILTDTPPEWRGFRFAGRYLVTPDGDRMTPQRLRGLAWRDAMELRRAGFASRRRAEAGTGARVKVIVVDLQDYRHNGIAAS
ncbi:MAG TPA: DUF3653 domain-containing protein [Luteimonas sp.]|nr:DUF3653 domain-containing protein [Luteimonas sp.]